MKYFKILSVLIFAGAISLFVNTTHAAEKYIPSAAYQDAYEAIANKEYQKAYRISIQAAEAGDIDVPGHLSYIYRYGLGKPRDLDKSIEWATKALTTNVLTTYYDLADVMEEKAIQDSADGKPFSFNKNGKLYPREIGELYDVMFLHDYPPAYIKMGDIALEMPPSKDMIKSAISFYKKGADLGHPSGRYNLVMLTLDGKYAYFSRNEIIEQLTLAADAGHLNSMALLVKLHTEGRYGPINQIAAMNYFFRVSSVLESKTRYFGKPIANFNKIKIIYDDIFAATTSEQKQKAIDLANPWIQENIAEKKLTAILPW